MEARKVLGMLQRLLQAWADRLRHRWEYLRSGYWAVPTVLSLVAIVLSLLTLYLDRAHGSTLARFEWLWSGGPEGARSLLSALAGSTITVAGVLFSIMVVVISQMSSQFGPRILRGFASDQSNQVVLGTFLGTYLYALLVLRTVRSDPGGFTPHLSITVALGASMLSMAFLIYFIHHMVVSIQAPVLVARLAAELRSGIENYRSELERWSWHDWPEAEGTPRALTCQQAGYLQTIDYDGLLAQAARGDLRVEVQVRAGQFLCAHDELARVWPGPDKADDLRDCFLLGDQPTPTQDLDFLLSQIVQVAVRSMSPGINDPFTAVICLEWLGDLLVELACCEQPGCVRLDEEGQPRLLRAARPGRLQRLLPSLRQLSFHVGDEPMARRALDRLLERLGGCFEAEERLSLSQLSRGSSREGTKPSGSRR